VPGVLARIGTPAAAQALMRHLLHADGQLRLAVLSALNKLHRERPDVELDPLALEAILAAEIVGHYRSYQIQARLRGDAPGDDRLLRGLQEAIGQELERIFRILELRFPENDLHGVYLGLRAADPVVRGHALDLLDQVLKPTLRRLLLPLVDGDVTAVERARLGERIVGTDVASREEALGALLGCQDPWLRACAVYAIGALGMTALASSLEPLADDPDPLLREAVRQARTRLSAASAAMAEPGSLPG
jgi:AAA family ATP:ADP antiporter